MSMKKVYLLLSGLLIYASISAQTPCSTGRYASEVYPTVTTTSNITYGQNASWTGANTTLKLDFYEPQGDTASARPLIIWVHGGSFQVGSKTDGDMVVFSQEFAKKGYVCASIDYRLGFFPLDSANAVKAVVRAVQDLRAALRFFYKDRETTNTYKIDTNHIFVGGSSAGAITALHLAYLNNECEIEDYLNTATITSLGGLEGNSGNAGYSSTVHGVLNGCGALARYSWLEAGDVPLCSVHGTNDGTVKYNRGIVNPGAPLMYLDGSRMLHERACAVGVENEFYTFPSKGHVPYAGNTPELDTTLNFFRDFLIQRMGCNDPILQPESPWLETANLYAINYCDGSPVNETCASSGTEEILSLKINMFPNPARSDVKVVWGSVEQMSVSVLDMMGREVRSNVVNDSEAVITCRSLKSGSYIVQLRDNRGNLWSRKLIIE